MKSLILTGWLSPEFTEPEFADLALSFFFRFGWGPLPSPDELATYLGPRTSDVLRGHHWSDFATNWSGSKNRSHRDLSLAEFCQRYESVELWFDTRPNAQLQLIWLLDYFRPYPETIARLKFRLVDLEMIGLDRLGKWRPPVVNITEKELEVASAAWRAYGAPTPKGCFDLLGRDLSALPLLKPVLIDLLEELPSSSTGLGASEMRMLELIARGYSLTNALFYLYQLRQTRIFGESELGYLLDGLAHGPRPAVQGLDEQLRTLDREKLRGRQEAYLRSELSLTEFGAAVLAHKEDFSRHNPIDRWWGGTHLTNDNLWRWNPALVAP
ncbi:hypothetical protein JQ609_09420 [Bradyrhizobium sp. AUGA SZCCT0169]|uniref:hypothetical protein n=1 Tax=Bradyrhizobium sp. AUGA SZCCT0169 TaxID=2807663 RepID=UPI001BA5ABD5|nr:hypothetical protein [Bradyrhizobium sp. AUGA SZCCT0169]MBR1247151.1 hypothetical protein [Bradyrhizobium sp. AUGA SZCCT0169]